MFIVILITFAFIGLIAIDGDYNSKEMQKDYEKYKEICNPSRKDKGKQNLSKLIEYGKEELA